MPFCVKHLNNIDIIILLFTFFFWSVLQNGTPSGSRESCVEVALKVVERSVSEHVQFLSLSPPPPPSFASGFRIIHSVVIETRSGSLPFPLQFSRGACVESCGQWVIKILPDDFRTSILDHHWIASFVFFPEEAVEGRRTWELWKERYVGFSANLKVTQQSVNRSTIPPPFFWSDSNVKKLQLVMVFSFFLTLTMPVNY